MQIVYRLCLFLIVLFVEGTNASLSQIWGTGEASTTNLGRSSYQTPSIIDQARLLQETFKTPINFREQTDPDLVAENLALFLYQAITTDDELSSRYSEKVASPNRKEWETFCGAWRMRTPVVVECRVDENKSLQHYGYVDCYASMAVGGRVVRERFARYFVITRPDSIVVQSDDEKERKPKDKSSLFTGTKQVIIQKYRKELADYAKTAKEQNLSIRKLFCSTSYHRRIFSPFHPSFSCPKIKFRTAKGQEKVSFAFLLPTIKDIDDSDIDIIKTFCVSAPNLFYRILADPQLPLPEGSLAELPVVHPDVIAVDPYVITDYVEGVKVFFSQMIKSVQQPEWSEVTPSEGSNAITKRLGGEILQLLNGAITGLSGYEFLDLSQPLPFLTASPKQPLIPECLGLNLFFRVLHGPRPGLWIAIRGQNKYESHTNAIGNFISSYVGKDISSTIAKFTPSLRNLDQTTEEFNNFQPALVSDMIVKKYHIARGKTSLFVVVIWDNNLDRHEGLHSSRPISPFSSKRSSTEETRKIAVIPQQPTGPNPNVPQAKEKSLFREYYQDYQRQSRLSSATNSPKRLDQDTEEDLMVPFGDLPPIEIPAQSRFIGKRLKISADEHYLPVSDKAPVVSNPIGSSEEDEGFTKMKS